MLANLLQDLVDLRENFPEEYEWGRLEAITEIQCSKTLEPPALVRIYHALRESGHINDSEWVAWVSELTSTESAASWVNEVMDVLPPEISCDMVKFDADLMRERFQKGAGFLCLFLS